jgi:thioredoxin 1
MNKLNFILLITIATFFNSCTNGQTHSGEKVNLSAQEFESKIKEHTNATILDVRTPGEYEKGHIENSINYDWNGNQFDKQIVNLDKSEPIYIYCLGGGRSAAAADMLLSNGFKHVYELTGGIMNWNAASLPVTIQSKSVSKGMTRQQFDDLLKSDKLILVNYNAVWCAPCKKMKPYLEEISTEMADKVIIIRIDADENQKLLKELNINSIPVLQLYKNNEIIWTHSGYISKEGVVEQLER